MSHPLPPKKEVALALLERSSVHVHLDPRAAGVVVPPWFKRQPQLILQIGLNMAVQIPDLRLDDEGMSCTLSFNRSPFYCVVPWPSVFAMVGEDGRGMVWPDEMPPELTKPAAQGATDGGDAAAKKPPQKRTTPSVEEARELRDARDARPRRVDRPAAAKDRPETVGKKKKKGSKTGGDEADARPLLVAIAGPGEAAPATPSAGASGNAAEKQADKPSERGLEAERPATARPMTAAKKPKRELPPYLRVVK